MSRRLDVLLIDDDLLVLRAMARQLGSYHEVRTATTLAAARDEVQRRRPDVVVSDWNLVDETAGGFLGELAEVYPAVRRVLHSGSSDAELVPGRVHAVLQKPARVEQILAALEPDC